MLGSIMGRDRADVSDILGESLPRIVTGEHAIAITLCQLRNIGVHRRQRLRRHLFDFVADRRFAAHDVEILAVEAKVSPHEFAQLFNLGVVVSAHHRVYVESQAVFEFIFQRIKRLDAGERFLPVAGNAADAIVSLAIAVQRDIQIEIHSGMRA